MKHFCLKNPFDILEHLFCGFWPLTWLLLQIIHPESPNTTYSSESNDEILFTIRNPIANDESSSASGIESRTEFRSDSRTDSVLNSDVEVVIDYENFQNEVQSKASEYYEEMVFSTGKKSMLEESLEVSDTYEDVAFKTSDNYSPRYENVIFDGSNSEKVPF